eukprot:UN03653
MCIPDSVNDSILRFNDCPENTVCRADLDQIWFHETCLRPSKCESVPDITDIKICWDSQHCPTEYYCSVSHVCEPIDTCCDNMSNDDNKEINGSCPQDCSKTTLCRFNNSTCGDGYYCGTDGLCYEDTYCCYFNNAVSSCNGPTEVCNRASCTRHQDCSSDDR